MAVPAEPQLASALWNAHQAAEQSLEKSNASSSLTTGLPAIDAALENGLSYGMVACLSGHFDSGGRDVAQAYLVSHLLGSSTATATIVDTALSFDVRRLHQALCSRISDQTDAPGQAAKILDRVKIMKVFDFVGLTECLAEVRDVLEGREVSVETRLPESRAPRGTIDDSEDESEDEMLDVSNSPPPPPLAAPHPAKTPQDRLPVPSLLIIDNITQVAAPLLKNNYVQGQAVLSSFMRSLSHLTRAHQICTILLNGVMSSPSVKDEAPSIFASCMLQPALGMTFVHMLDVHMLVHRMAKSAPKNEGPNVGSAEEASVIEVLHDRYGGRAGKWAPFVVDELGRLSTVT